VGDLVLDADEHTAYLDGEEISFTRTQLMDEFWDADTASGTRTVDGFQEISRYFNRMAKELSGLETLRTDFIANVSHELKMPLAVMQNYGTMLGQPGLSEEKRIEYAKAVTDASRRLADLIINILKLNKLENQQIYPQAKEYDLSEQLCQSLLQFENVWEKRTSTLRTIPQKVSVFMPTKDS